MRVVLPGGTGQVGVVLRDAMVRAGHDVVVLTRDASPREPPGADVGLATTVGWDGRTPGAWVDAIDGADVVVNLAGHNVNCRYTAENRRRILESRVASTRAVGDAIASCAKPPRVWLQMSTATIYAHRYDAPHDERTGFLGGSEPGVPASWRFSIEVARAWERALDAARTPHTRRVKLRSAVALSPHAGGIFDVLLGLVRRGLGGTAGDGRQFVSWVHHEDFVRSVAWLIEHEEIEGVVNIASPNPEPNAEFMRHLREAWGTRIGLPATRSMLEVGTFLLRTETELVLKSRRVVPGRLLEGGFAFRHPTWAAAARDLCADWRAMHRA